MRNIKIWPAKIVIAGIIPNTDKHLSNYFIVAIHHKSSDSITVFAAPDQIRAIQHLNNLRGRIEAEMLNATAETLTQSNLPRSKPELESVKMTGAIARLFCDMFEYCTDLCDMVAATEDDFLLSSHDIN